MSPLSVMPKSAFPLTPKPTLPMSPNVPAGNPSSTPAPICLEPFWAFAATENAANNAIAKKIFFITFRVLIVFFKVMQRKGIQYAGGKYFSDERLNEYNCKCDV